MVAWTKKYHLSPKVAQKCHPEKTAGAEGLTTIEGQNNYSFNMKVTDLICAIKGQNNES